MLPTVFCHAHRLPEVCMSGSSEGRCVSPGIGSFQLKVIQILVNNFIGFPPVPKKNRPGNVR